MKTIFLLYCLLNSVLSSAQEKLVKDLDGDKLKDTIFIDTESSRIISKLSTQKFKEVMSKEVEFLGDQNGIRTTKSGFELSSSFMRAGHAAQFRYDTVAKRIRLIGLSTYEFGNATNDGSGEGSVNMLTHIYIGEWNFFDNVKEKLAKLPKIKEKMSLGKIYLEEFDGKILDVFLEKSSELYYKQKSRFSK